jgi:hypothetical protein
MGEPGIPAEHLGLRKGFALSTLFTTAQDAAAALKKGQTLNVDVDIAVDAIALTIPALFKHIDPTSTDGRRSLANFRMLADRAGLPHDHSVFASWFLVRSLRLKAGDAATSNLGCPVAAALLSTIGVAPVVTDGWFLSNDIADTTAATITAIPVGAGETGAIATPVGTLRVPGSTITSTRGDWASALAAVDQVAGTIGRQGYDADPDAAIELAYARPARGGSVDADSIHEDWAPEIAFHEDLLPHPSRLIQSATLATVEPPVTTYRPRLTRRVIKSGRISDAQFDFIVAAGQAHSRHLPADPCINGDFERRVGIFLADGTGAGKTNEMLGVVMDNRLHGRAKAILIVEKRRHLPGFVEAWASMGCDRRDFIPLWDYKAEDRIPATRGILVATYSMLRDFDPVSKHFVRVNQIQAWAERDFAGPLLMDEAQAMRNAAGDEDSSGKASEISQQGVAGVALQDALPDARVVYASATGATDVHNLGYATRLGIWGVGTAFDDRQHFIKTFEEGNIGDLEQVTLSLKACGVYVARSISYEGVEVVNLPIILTPQERDVYNQAAEMWTRLYDAFRRNAQLCGIPSDPEEIHKMRQGNFKLKGAIPYSHLNSVYEANRKNSMSTLIAAFKARGVIVDAKRRIDEGQSVVIQMQNTYEAQLNRAIDRLEDAENIRLEPAELVSFAEMLPVEQYEIVEQRDPVTNAVVKVFTPKLDGAGQPVINLSALHTRNKLIADARSIVLPPPPLDQIMLAFGPARMGEVTGRTIRLVPDKANGDRDGAAGVRIERRTEADRMQDIQDFHDGKKVVLAFSTGAGGSSMSYHAKTGTPAGNRRRVQYLIQLGYRADEVTQGLGRTHRSDQTCPPIACLVTVDLPADRLYASRIVSSLFKLGALTQGHRHATSNGMFDERDCLDGPLAKKAWDDLKEEIKSGSIKNYTWEAFMQDLGLDENGQGKFLSWGRERTRYILNDPNKLMNRVAALTDRRQQLIFDRLRELIDKRIEAAIVDGTFNAGPETLKATSLTLMSEQSVSRDPLHGGETRILRVRRKSQLDTVSFGDAYKQYLRARGRSMQATFCKHRSTGGIALLVTGKPMVNMLDERIPTLDIITPTGTNNRPKRIVAREPWLPFTDLDVLEGMWNAAVEAAPTESTSFVTLVADALLPVWPELDRASMARTAVYRLQTDEGRQIVGRPITAKSLPMFCRMLDTSYEPSTAEIDEVISHLQDGKVIALASGSASPHYLSGNWANGRLVGASVDLSSIPCQQITRALCDIPGAGHSRLPNTTCEIASRSADLAGAIGTVMAACPAITVIDDIMLAKTKQQAQSTPAAASAPLAAVAP